MDSEVRYISNILQFVTYAFKHDNDAKGFWVYEDDYPLFYGSIPSGSARKYHTTNSLGITTPSRKNFSDKENSEELKRRLLIASEVQRLPEMVIDVECSGNHVRKNGESTYGCEVRYEYRELFNKMNKKMTDIKNQTPTTVNDNVKCSRDYTQKVDAKTVYDCKDSYENQELFNKMKKETADIKNLSITNNNDNIYKKGFSAGVLYSCVAMTGAFLLTILRGK